ncbi:MAG: hypothetical protein SGPRY_014104 [Prymnesium sp.]
MSDWENSWPEAEAALREAARVHAAALSREKEVTRLATRRAHAAEKALRALPAALERARAAEEALRQLGEQQGSLPVRPLVNEDSLVSEQAAASAAADAAEAAAAGSEAESEAYCEAISVELVQLELLQREREAHHQREMAALREEMRVAHDAHQEKETNLLGAIDELKREGAESRAQAEACEAGLHEQLAHAHSAGAESEALLQEERKAGEAAAAQAQQREEELSFGWEQEANALRAQLAEANQRADVAHRLLCEQVGRELETLGGLATKLYRPTGDSEVEAVCGS